MRTMRSKRFRLSDDTPKSDRVYMSEGGKLPGKPNPRELSYACSRGCCGTRCPSRRGPSKKRWTTVEAYLWYLEEINGDE